MDNKPLISVIIPTYNRATKVTAAIESVLRQTYTNVQLIVADDGSTDNTAAVLKNYPAVEYLDLPHGGQAWARNQGLLRVKGEYIATLDSDDIWNNDFLEICLEALESRKLDFVFANWTQDMGKGRFINWFSICEILKNTLKEYPEEWVMLSPKKLRELYLIGCPSPSSSLILRRSSLQCNWNGDLRIADDWCLLMDMIYNKPCNAALTRQVLWTKNVDGQNIYDGRNIDDITRDLWVYDIELLFLRFNKLFTKKEIKAFKKCQAYHLFIYSYYQLRFYKQFKKSFYLLKKAISIDTTFVFPATSKMIRKILKPQ